MPEAKKRLGRGLDALLSSTRLEQISDVGLEERIKAAPITAAVGHEFIEDLPLEKINRNPHQPRQVWDEEKLHELAESIRVLGLVQPIIVRPMGQGYQLIAGERRLRACQKAGKNTIAAIVRDANEEQMIEWALVENIHRDDLNPIERARAYHHYMERFNLTQQQVAERIGEDRSTIANYVRLLELSDELRNWVGDGRLSMGHARALLGLTEGKRIKLAQDAVGQKWSVRELERRVQAEKSNVNNIPRPARNPHIVELEQEMTRALGTKVTIVTNGRKADRGKIIIEFYSLDDFDRIREALETETHSGKVD